MPHRGPLQPIMPLLADLPRWPRLLVAALGVLLGLGTVGYAVQATFTLGGADVSAFFVTWIGNIVLGIASVLCVLRGVLVRGERAPWIVLGTGMALWTGGNVYWFIFFADLETPPFPSVSDALWLGLYPAAYVSLFLFIRARVTHFHPSMWFDGLIGGTAVAAVGIALVFEPIRSAATGGAAAVATNLAYPLGDSLLLALVVGGFAVSGWRPGRAWSLLAAGFVMLAVADSVYFLRIAEGTYELGSVLDAVWPAGMALLGFAAWQRPRPITQAQLEGLRVLAVPGLFTAMALSLQLWDHFARVPTLAMVLAVVTLAVALLRVGLTFREVRELANTRREALTDDLTGLPNRRSLYRHLGETIQRADGSDVCLAVLLLDLNRFKELNDTLGHHVGDAMLMSIADRLDAAVAPQGSLARLGGDEFCVVLPDAGEPAEALAVARSLRAVVCQPIELDGMRLRVDVSIGVACFPADGQTTTEILQRADVAMYAAKTHKTGCELYSSDRDHHTREHLVLVADLHDAAEQDQFVLHFQPQAAIATGEVIGVEALVRWQHPTHGLLFPDRFIALAEQTGLMRQLTAWVIGAALEQTAAWRERGLELTMSVNLTASDLLDLDLPAAVESSLQRFGVPPHLLQLEITEDTLMTDPNRATATLDALRCIGVRCSLDDFGTGYSSLGQLKRLPVDEIKIDRSFVMEMAEDEDDAAIVRSIVQLGGSLHLRVVAEGIEDQRSWDMLAGYGCGVAQGYHLSRPVPAAALEAWLDRADAVGPALEAAT